MQIKKYTKDIIDGLLQSEHKLGMKSRNKTEIHRNPECPLLITTLPFSKSNQHLNCIHHNLVFPVLNLHKYYTHGIYIFLRPVPLEKYYIC